MRQNVCLASTSDIPSWLEIVREVESLFGPMPMFDATLKTKIAHNDALCVHDERRAVIGGLLLGGTPPDNWIRWLAVRSSARRRGVATMLVKEALARCTPPCAISLATFGDDNAQGLAVHRLYAGLGFVTGETLPGGPEGGTRRLFRIVRA